MRDERSRLGAGREFDHIRRFLADADAEDADTDDGDAVDAGAPNLDASNARVLVGPGDDCAVIRVGTLAVSSDLSIEGVHFRRDWLQPDEIGYRATSAALSDLAAVTAEPVAALVSLAVPVASSGDIAPAIMRGARAAARAVGATIIGGDLTRAHDAIAIDVVVLGRVENAVLRSGALPGDELWVTGELGGAAAAVQTWLGGGTPQPGARRAYAMPTPRTAEAAWLHERGALHALIDLSDGVASDADHLAAASGVSIMIDEPNIPIHPAALVAESAGGDALQLALAGGEDYELLFAAPADVVQEMSAEFERTFRLRLTRVGSVIEGAGVHVRSHDGRVRALDRRGFDHFATGERGGDRPGNAERGADHSSTASE